MRGGCDEGGGRPPYGYINGAGDDHEGPKNGPNEPNTDVPPSGTYCILFDWWANLA